MNFDFFRSQLRIYGHMGRSLAQLEADRDRLIYEMSGVKGIRFDKERGTVNPAITAERRHDLSQRLEEIERQINFTQMFLKKVDDMLNRLPEDVRTYCVMLYIDNHSLKTVCDMVGYSPGGLYKKVKGEVEKLEDEKKAEKSEEEKNFHVSDGNMVV